MAVFKFKDLVVSLGPAAGPAAPQCPVLSICGPISNCGINFSNCGFVSQCQFHTLVTCPTFSCHHFTCGFVSPCGPFTPCGHFSPCGPLSPCGHFSPCGPISPCGFVSPGPGCGPTFDPAVDPAQQVENLATLKAQLQQALAQVEQAEKAAADAVKPQTVQEVDELEKKLTDALSELKARREELQKKK